MFMAECSCTSIVLCSCSHATLITSSHRHLFRHAPLHIMPQRLLSLSDTHLFNACPCILSHLLLASLLTHSSPSSLAPHQGLGRVARAKQAHAHRVRSRRHLSRGGSPHRGVARRVSLLLRLLFLLSILPLCIASHNHCESELECE